ncbi:MAG: type I DNA topoisomerase [Pleomorphochaeta sp.]
MQDLDDQKTLIIVESPTKAKTIKKFLPANCTVVASNGHIRDLDSDKNAVDVENNFKPHYIIPSEKKALVKSLKEELKKSEYLLLATDEDREGESISWHLLQVLKPKVDYKRMVFHEITNKAIKNALNSGRDLDVDMVHAQEARRIIDRLFGYDVSSIVGQKLSSRKLSAGRVQSPGLMLTVEREKERISYIKSIYFDAKAKFNTSEGKFEAKLVEYNNKNLASSKSFDSTTGKYKNDNTLLLDEKSIDDIIKDIENGPFTVNDIISKPISSKPTAPFITSTLQQEAIKKLHFSSKETMRVAQRLYENGLITYMRTDSPFLSQEGINGARTSVQELYGEEYLSKEVRQFKAKNAEAQEAHEAIRPSGEKFVSPKNSGLTGKELSLYSLIWARTLASQMAEAKKRITTIKIQSNGAIFSASGTQIIFPGYLRAYVEAKDDPEAALDDKETLLPKVEKGEELELNELISQKHETKPPARYTEASLVRELEQKGIGRPSTYASIIDTLLNRQYLVKEGSALVPTFVGFAVCQYLSNSFPKYVDYDFTRLLEADLDDIANHKIEKTKLLKDFYLGEKGLQSRVKEEKSKKDKVVAKTLILPQIDEANPIMIGPYGPYVLGKVVNDKQEYINLPKEMLPGTVTDEEVKALIKKGKVKNEPILLGEDDNNNEIYLCSGRFGPYWQIGKDSANKPKRASIPSWYQKEETAQKDLTIAKKYLSLPRELGKDENGQTIFAMKGKYGPYLNCGDLNVNLNKRDHDEQLFSVTLEEALDLIKNGSTKGSKKKSAAKTALKDFGEFNGESVKLHVGRYGYYLKQGKTNIPIDDEKARSDEDLAMNLSKEIIEQSLKKKKSKGK